MKIAIFDHVVTNNNAIGICHRRVMSGLGTEYDSTLYSCEFDDPLPALIRWTQISAIRCPLAAMFVSFHIAAAYRYSSEAETRMSY